MNALIATAMVLVAALAVPHHVVAAECRVGPVARGGQVKLGEEQPDPEKLRKDAIERAKAHLVKTAGVKLDEIAVESATPVTWPDASLGCPEKDRMYAQVVSEGHKVILRVGDVKHELHVGRSRVVSCKAK